MQTQSMDSQKPLDFATLLKAHKLLTQVPRPAYDVIVAPTEISKKLRSLPEINQHFSGMRIIAMPEPRRYGIFKWRLLRMLLSPTKNIIQEWHWNRRVYLLDTKKF